MPSFPAEKEEALIKAVESRPALYNKSDKKYSNRDFVGKLWIEVAEEIESEGWHHNLFAFVVVVDKSINSVVTISSADCQLVRRNKT